MNEWHQNTKGVLCHMATKTFQKKPEQMTAVQWINTDSYWEICTFLGIDLTYIGAKKLLEIPVNEGYVYANPTDWVIKYTDGSVHVMTDALITANYDDITAASTPATGGTV